MARVIVKLEAEDFMTRMLSIVTYALVGALTLSSPLAHAGTATQADLDHAIAKTLADEDAARGAITALLQRDEVRSVAKSHGLDLRRAEAAVETLTGAELQRLSLLAADANLQLAGGAQTITISVVTLLLIVIIIILLVD
jgi:hypothetical protein